MKAIVIGAGNVGSQIAWRLAEISCEVAQVCGRDKEKVSALAKKVGAEAIFDYKDLDHDADVCFLAIKDDAIQEVAEAIAPIKNDFTTYVHLSGTAELEKLKVLGKKTGVMWPLQTIKSTDKLDWAKIPLLIECHDEETEELLVELAARISGFYQVVTGEQRRWLHLCAVLVNNYVNHLYALASGIVSDQGLNFNLLRPIIFQTASKASLADPRNLQTGPAARGDLGTIQKHEALLTGNEELVKLYDAFVASISKGKG